MILDTRHVHFGPGRAEGLFVPICSTYSARSESGMGTDRTLVFATLRLVTLALVQNFIAFQGGAAALRYDPTMQWNAVHFAHHLLAPKGVERHLLAVS